MTELIPPPALDAFERCILSGERLSAADLRVHFHAIAAELAQPYLLHQLAVASTERETLLDEGKSLKAANIVTLIAICLLRLEDAKASQQKH